MNKWLNTRIIIVMGEWFKWHVAYFIHLPLIQIKFHSINRKMLICAVCLQNIVLQLNCKILVPSDDYFHQLKFFPSTNHANLDFLQIIQFYHEKECKRKWFVNNSDNPDLATKLKS